MKLNNVYCELPQLIEVGASCFNHYCFSHPQWYGVVLHSWNQTVDRALISGVTEEDILDMKREKISEEVKIHTNFFYHEQLVVKKKENILKLGK